MAPNQTGPSSSIPPSHRCHAASRIQTFLGPQSRWRSRTAGRRRLLESPRGNNVQVHGDTVAHTATHTGSQAQHLGCVTEPTGHRVRTYGEDGILAYSPRGALLLFSPEAPDFVERVETRGRHQYIISARHLAFASFAHHSIVRTSGETTKTKTSQAARAGWWFPRSRSREYKRLTKFDV